MGRYTLLQLLKGISLLAIITALLKSDGCGGQFDQINAIAFSRDDSQIMVSTIRGQSTLLRPYQFKHFSRTISWLDGQTGKSREVIRQDYQRWMNRTVLGTFKDTVALNPSNNSITFIDFDGVKICSDVKANKWIDLSSDPVSQINLSKNGKYLAVLSLTGLRVIELASESNRLFIPRQASQFNWCLFPDDESKIFVSQVKTTSVWDLDESILVGQTPYTPSRHEADVLELGPEDTLVVCRNGTLELCDTSGAKVAEISKGYFRAACISADKKVLAVDNSDVIQIINLDDYSIRTSLPSYARMQESLVLNSDGSELAIGRYGKVALIDTITGDPIWSRSPPSRFGNPWYIPAGLLLAWCLTVSRFWCFIASRFWHSAFVKVLFSQLNFGRSSTSSRFSR